MAATSATSKFSAHSTFLPIRLQNKSDLSESAVNGKPHSQVESDFCSHTDQ
jgi:hypothetical protein